MPLLSKKHQNKSSDVADPNYGGPNAQNPGDSTYAGQTGYPQGSTGPTGYNTAPETGYGEGYRGGAGVGNAPGVGLQPGLQSSTDKHGNPVHPGDMNTSGMARQGKFERAVGTLTGSTALKEKGLAKEQEAAALKAQAFELGHAERLEQEALARRNRAVAHGAHPQLRHLGGIDPNLNNNAGIGSGNNSSNIANTSGLGQHGQNMGGANTGIGNYVPASDLGPNRDLGGSGNAGY